jgi:fructose-1,6-bisphosphatase I
VVAIDPLDGSSNIDVNVSVGSIFSIYKRITPNGTPLTKKDFLQKGINQVAAGYILYGTSTMLVLTLGDGVCGFTYESTLGEYVLSHKDIEIPDTGSIYSINDGLNNFIMNKTVIEYINDCRKQKLTARYIGSLVADFHRNLLKGGIYLYPETIQSPEGKLRLLFECNALAFIVEQAGGKATNGKNRIMEIEPLDFHQKSSLYIGSSQMVDQIA